MASNKETVFGFVWVFLEKFGYSLITLVSTLILARLLSPYEFGLIGTVAIFVSVSDMIVEAGFGAALVQKKNISDKDYSTVFIFNILISLLLYIILFIAAPKIASYYNNEVYTLIIRLLGLKLILNAITLTQRVHLLRALNFKKQTQINLIAVVLSVVISIVMAYYDYGVWALVAQTVLYSFFVSILMFIYVRFIPLLYFSKQSFKELFGFGGKIILNSILRTAYDDIFGFIITKKYSTNLTGNYTQANRLTSFPNSIFSSLYDNAGFPILSRINNELEFKNKVSLINKGVFLIAMPLLLLIPFQANNIVEIVLGEKWLAAAPILSILSVSLLTSLISIFSTNILKAKGKGNEILKYGILKIIIGFVVLFFTLQISFNALLYGIVLTNLTYSLIVFNYITKITLYNWSDLFNDIVIFMISVLTINFVVKFLIFNSFNFLSSLVELVLFSIISIIIYIITNYFFNKSLVVKLKELIVTRKNK